MRGVRRIPGAGEGVATRRDLALHRRRGAAGRWCSFPGIGKSVNGSRRWLSLVVVNIQPSEFMKLAVVLYAASYAVRKAAFLHAEQPLRQTLLRGFAPLFAVMVLIGGLLLLEPDFGAFVVIVAIAFGDPVPRRARLAAVPRASRCCCRSRWPRSWSPRRIACSG